MKRNIIILVVMCWAHLLCGSPQGVAVNSTATVGTSSVSALAANPNRGYLMIQNNGTVTCQVKFGTAITSTEGIKITAGQYYEPVNAFIKSAVFMKCAGAGQSISFVEANY